jgi:hypothetical protein
VRWYEITDPNGTPTVTQQSTYAPDITNWRWTGSIAMDAAGDMLLGYSVSSSSMKPSVAITGRIPSDTPSTMEAENLWWTGTGYDTSGAERWGDYSSMAVDPVDDCTFWYTQETQNTIAAWAFTSRVGTFKFSSCVIPDFSVSASPTSVTLLQGGSGTSVITTAVVGIFSDAVTLSASGQPSGVTVTFSTNPIPAPGSGTSTMTIIVGPAVGFGSYPITVTATGGGKTHTTTVTLTVTSNSPDFSIVASPTTVSIAQNAQGASTITTAVADGFSSAITLSASGQPSGVTVNFSTNPIPAPGSGTSTMTVVVGGQAAIGTYTITLEATGDSITHSATVTLEVVPTTITGWPQATSSLDRTR